MSAVKLGYKNVYILPAGIKGWEKAQKPIEKELMAQVSLARGPATTARARETIAGLACVDRSLVGVAAL